MIIVHAVQKLLNISRLKPALFISEPPQGQQLHAWYAKLISTGFAGKLLVMYVHHPSLLVVLTQGKTVTRTIPAFCNRLEALLKRNNFKADFIEREMQLVKEGYVISKTNSKSMLASMNAITFNIEARGFDFESYEAIDISSIEDSYLDYLTQDRSKPVGYRFTRDFWKDIDVIN